MPTYQYGKGTAIGNKISQIFGLIYLNGINHYIKEELHLKNTFKKDITFSLFMIK